ncbi:MAG: alpha/beta fold hydrolase [Collinsella sp.]|nr:alpha/beta fold hydrolase [Collinsella sp.]
MKTTTITYASHDGASTIRALLWRPEGKAAASPRGLVQIVHGMSEHIERYGGFAEYLCGRGFAVCANDHIGHGKTVECAADLGHMPLEAGEDILIRDVNALRKISIDRIAAESGCDPAGIPYIIFGHSMGSFITRVYLTRYALGVRAAIICGTGQQARPLSLAGRLVTKVLARSRGERYVSEFVDGLGAGAYGGQIKDARTDVDWIATDPDVVDEYRRDPLCGQKFTVGAYHTLSSLVADATDARLASRIPRSLPLYLIAGSADPVGECGAGVERAAAMYRRAGIVRVDMKIYPGARHEILNEPIKGEVHADVGAWIDEVLGA